MTPGVDDLWFLPLGGTGEIGMNMNLYGHDGQWLMVDCGVSFDEPLSPGSEILHHIVAADPSFIEARRNTLAGIVVTHAHEDHLGALPWLWHRLKAPVYATAFTAEILRRKLRSNNIGDDIPVHIVPDNAQFHVGPFDLQWISITHSLPETSALVIRTEAGSLLHTADWKMDPRPVVGQPFNPQPFKLLGEHKLTAMVCDSTNATHAGRSVSESDCYRGLQECIKQHSGRVVVSCFSSNIARLRTLAKLAESTERYMGLIGRSLKNMVSAARFTGHWPEEAGLIDPYHLGYLPREEVLAVVTGSQGEPRAMLNRLAEDSCRELSLEEGDLVILSAMLIPGNEEKVHKMVSKFKQRNIKIVLAEDTDIPVHASGHPCKDELIDMYTWVKPAIAVPTHGEARHLQANAEIAGQAGIARQLTGQNGDLFKLAPIPSVRRKAAVVGRIPLEQ